MQVLSHRGFHKSLAENTLESFEAAIALNVDGIETDIRMTCDNQPILYHNPQVPDGKNISDLTQTDISHRVGYDVPRLEDAIALTRSLDQSFCWNLELKTRDACLDVLDIIRRLRPNTAIAFTSFWHDAIVEMSQTAPEFDYGLLWASHPYGFEAPQWFEAYPQITSLVFYQERLSRQLVEMCHQKGKAVWTYGDRTASDRLQLQEWDVDAVISDRPDLLLEGQVK